VACVPSRIGRGCKNALAVNCVDRRRFGFTAAVLHARHFHRTGFHCAVLALHGLRLRQYRRSFSIKPLAAGSQRALCVFAGRQRYGIGSGGGFLALVSPGGVWLSAACPGPRNPATARSGLAVAVGLALHAGKAGDLKAEIRANDLLLADAAMAGLLPRLRLRSGRIPAGAQVGLGVNADNGYPRERIQAWPKR